MANVSGGKTGDEEFASGFESEDTDSKITVGDKFIMSGTILR